MPFLIMLFLIMLFFYWSFLWCCFLWCCFWLCCFYNGAFSMAFIPMEFLWVGYKSDYIFTNAFLSLWCFLLCLFFTAAFWSIWFFLIFNKILKACLKMKSLLASSIKYYFIGYRFIEALKTQNILLIT